MDTKNPIILTGFILSITSYLLSMVMRNFNNLKDSEWPSNLMLMGSIFLLLTVVAQLIIDKKKKEKNAEEGTVEFNEKLSGSGSDNDNDGSSWVDEMND